MTRDEVRACTLLRVDDEVADMERLQVLLEVGVSSRAAVGALLYGRG